MILFKKMKIKRLLKKIKSMQSRRLHDQPSVEALKKERAFYHRLAALYLSLSRKKKHPFARTQALECYRTAADTEDPDAHFLFARALIDEAKVRSVIQEEGILANPGNERQLKQLFAEAFIHLEAAVQLKHVASKRLLGVCYVKGWGVSVDQEKGFDLLVTSIDEENAWDKVSQIFQTLGLNKPEFFSMLMRHRSKK